MTWAELENAVSDVVDATFAEAFEFRPMKKETVNSPECPDDGRSVRAVVGVFSAPASDIDLTEDTPDQRRVYGGDGYTRNTMNMPRIGLDDRQFLAAEMPRKDDRLRRNGTGLIYRVSDVQPDGQGRIVLVVNEAGKE